jgi:ABC-2 type transport system permease protein
VERGEAAAVQVLLDGRRSNAAQILGQYLEQIVQDAGRDTPRGLAVQSGGPSGAVTPGMVTIDAGNWFNPNLDFKWFILPNLIGMINFVMGIIITGLTVAREREIGTFDQTLVSPAAPVEVAVGKLIPGCAVGLFHGTIFYIAARWFFGVPFAGSLAILCASMLLFSLSVSSLGLMVSSLASTQQQAFLGSFTIVVPCVLLSGFMTPINNMPVLLQGLSQINPLRHFIVILQGVFLKDISLAAALDSGLRIALIAVVTVTLAIWMFRRGT